MSGCKWYGTAWFCGYKKGNHCQCPEGMYEYKQDKWGEVRHSNGFSGKGSKCWSGIKIQCCPNCKLIS